MPARTTPTRGLRRWRTRSTSSRSERSTTNWSEASRAQSCPKTTSSRASSRGAPETLGERFGDPGGPDPGEATSSGASASAMRERAAQALNPEMGRMGAEDPSTAFPVVSLVDTHLHLEELGEPNDVVERAVTAGVTRMIAMGTDLPRSRGAVSLANRFQEWWAGGGHYPLEQSAP